MSYQVVMTTFAKKQFKKLSKEIQERIIAVLERSKIRPFAVAVKIVGTNYFRFRVGDYRVIVDIRQNELVIMVIEIAHRKNIYKV